MRASLGRIYASVPDAATAGSAATVIKVKKTQASAAAAQFVYKYARVRNIYSYIRMDRCVAVGGELWGSNKELIVKKSTRGVGEVALEEKEGGGSNIILSIAPLTPWIFHEFQSCMYANQAIFTVRNALNALNIRRDSGSSAHVTRFPSSDH